MTAHSEDQPTSGGKVPRDITTAKGTHFYKANHYHTKLMTYAQQLSEVASVTLRMKRNGVLSQENVHFANLLETCGNELLDIGQHLKTCASNIKAVRIEFCHNAKKQKQKNHTHTL